MRLVLDTNILISAFLNKKSKAALLLDAWERRLFEVVTCDEQLDEFHRVTRYPKLSRYIRPADADSLQVQLTEIALHFDNLPAVDASPDPGDNWLLGLAEAAQADYLVSGDKRGVLELARHRETKILALANMIEQLSLGR